MSTRIVKILLIEDHEDSAVVLARVLKHDGHQVTTAMTVKEAERACENREFDLLVCDIELPDGNSFHLLDRARQSCASASGIILSAYDDDRRRLAARRAGFEQYLVKPVRLERLREAIARAAGLKAAEWPVNTNRPPTS